MKRWLLLLIPTLLLYGCENQNKQPQPLPSPNEEEQKVSLLQYFLQDPSEKSFQGIGNEFAQYSETFYENEGPYYPAIMDNGGNRFFRIYKVTENEISLVYEKASFFEEETPSPSSLIDEFQDQPILKLPLNVGTRVGDWKIVNTSKSIQVAMGKFSNVIVIEKTTEDGSIIRQYWVEIYGKIKDEYIVKDEKGNQFEISSELKSIK